MSFVKHINVNDGSGRKYEDLTVGELKLDTKPELGSFNGVTSDAVARAVAGASGEVPQVTEDDNGKVLKAVYDEGGPGVEWGEAGGSASVDQSYDPTSENAQSGTAVAEAIAGHTCTAGNGITISGNGVVSVNDGDGLRITYDAVQSGIQVGDAFKYHVGDISAATDDIGFSISISAPQFNKFFSSDSSISSTHLVVVAANPSDTSIYAIGPICYDFDWELASGVAGTMVDTEGSDITVSGSVFSAFGRDAFLSTIDSNGDVLLYLCATVDGTVLLGSGNGPGGSACASMMWGPYDNTRPYFSITLGEELAGPGRLDVANPVPSYNTAEDGKVLGVVDNGGTAELQWVSAGGGSDQPLPAVAADTLRFEFEDMSYDPTNQAEANFTGTSWAKVTESVTRNIWDCTLASAAAFSTHFAFTSVACKVIDGNWTKNDLRYLFKDSSSLEDIFFKCSNVNGIRFMEFICSGCSNLKNVTLWMGPNRSFDVSVEESFYGCHKLESICIYDRFGAYTNSTSGNYITLGGNTFGGCYNLKTLTGVWFEARTIDNRTISIFQSCCNLHGIANLFKYGVWQLKGLSIQGLFEESGITTIPAIQIVNNLFNAYYAFAGSAIANIPLLDVNHTSSSLKQLCAHSHVCTARIINTENVTDMSYLFEGDACLSKIPELQTDSVTNVSNMFAGCVNASGALAMYQQLSQQANPPTTTAGCFTNCGINLPGGAAELAQIPASWGGTGA